MTLSRRAFLAATAATTLGGTQLASATSPPGDVVGKVVRHGRPGYLDVYHAFQGQAPLSSVRPTPPTL
ncbi:hypothetical protein AB0F43_22780 [Kribbella sp. NPDC023972]|uniref:hypothetical protein n=1 Tax=Kribbella sp. NPDC023972 TaxID=3154795 RepID=UPI0033D535F1